MDDNDTTFAPDPAPAPAAAPLPEPSQGGSYARNADGSLELLERTEQSSRAQRAADAASQE